jgi:SAM-dependent methyltransferase
MDEDDRLTREVAEALEAEPALLPLLPELLADLWALGSDPELISELLRKHGLVAGARVLDLGCGKGAVSIALAREIGARVIGVDAFEPFIGEARRQAEQTGVSRACRFEVGDLRDWLTPRVPFDAVILASVGPVLGGYAATVRGLRAAVRAGGLVLIEDCFLRQGEVPLPGLPYRGYEATLHALTDCGDELVEEVITPLEVVEATNRHNNNCIRARAKALARRHPEHAPRLREYVARQERECEVLETRLCCAVWVLRRGRQ